MAIVKGTNWKKFLIVAEIELSGGFKWSLPANCYRTTPGGGWRRLVWGRKNLVQVHLNLLFVKNFSFGPDQKGDTHLARSDWTNSNRFQLVFPSAGLCLQAVF